MSTDREWRGSNEKVGRKRRLKTSAKVASGLLVNVAEALSPDERQEIAKLCLDDFMSDMASRADWDAQHADWLAVYNQTDGPESPPWQGSSDECLGLLTEACNSFQARAYKAFFPSRLPIAALPVGRQSPDSASRAKRVAKYLQWKLFVQDQNYKEDKSAMLLRVAVHGSDLTQTYFDPILNKVVVEPVRATDFYASYAPGPVSVEDLTRKTKLIHPSLNDCRIRAAAGYFLVPAEPMQIGALERLTQQQADSDGGVSLQTSDSIDFCQVIEQHRDLDLDGDGIAEPYKVWVDVTSEELLRIEVRYEVDDRGLPVNGRLPIEEFTHYRFLVNPDGFYGYGLGFLIGKANIAINKMLRQFIDGTTLSIVGSMSGFISDNLDTGGAGPVKIEMGALKRVTASTDDIQRGIKTLDFKPPGDGLVRAISQLESRSQRIGSATDALAGDVQKVYQPTTMQTMVEQGLTLFTSVQDFLLNSWSKELMKVYRLNSLFFQGTESFPSVTPNGVEENWVTQADFADDMMIMPVADPRMGNKQERLQKAQFLFDHSTKNPLIASNPGILLKVTRRLYEEMEIDNIDELLPRSEQELPPPQPDPKIEALKAKVQADQQKVQIQAQSEQQKIALEAKRSQMHAQTIAMESQAEIQIENQKAQAEITRENAKAQAEMALERERMQHERVMSTVAARQDAQIKAQKADADIKLAKKKAAMKPKPKGGKDG